VLGDRLAVELAVLELGPVLDQNLRDREADDLVRVLGVREGDRDRVVPFLQQVLVPDDQPFAMRTTLPSFWSSLVMTS
jgi:hypothetical protein